MDAAAGIAATGSTVYLFSCRCAAEYIFATIARTIPYPVHQWLIVRIYGLLTARGQRAQVSVFDPLAYKLWLLGRPDTHEHRQIGLIQG